MMDAISKSELQMLLQMHAARCLTLIFPPPPLFPFARLFKNLWHLAEAELSASGLPARRARSWLERLRRSVDVGDWKPGQSLILLATEDFCRCYRLPFRLPELALVSSRFYLKPFFQVDIHEEALVLALSAKAVRLFRFSPSGMAPVPVPGIPAAETSAPERKREHQGPRAGGTVFGSIRKKRHLSDYCRQVGGAVSDCLREEQAPLVLAAAEPLYSLFRESNSGLHLAPAGLPGNPDKLSAADLHRLLLPLRRGLWLGIRKRDWRHYLSLAAAGRAIHHPRTILEAAEQGAIDVLFISGGEHLWGRPRPGEGWEFHDRRLTGDEDLLDRAAAKTYLSGGKVYFIERESIPDHALMAAALRPSAAWSAEPKQGGSHVPTQPERIGKLDHASGTALPLPADSRPAHGAGKAASPGSV